LVNNAFGNLVYEMKISEYGTNYKICEFKESIKKIEE